MSMETSTKPRASIGLAMVQLASICLLGLVLLPGLLGGDLGSGLGPTGQVRPVATFWLAGGLFATAWLLAIVPALVGALALALTSMRTSEPATRSSSVARLVVAFGCLLLAHGILRRPVVAVAGALFDPATVEAVFAAGSLVLLLLILLWLFRMGRPLLESVALQALDVMVPTTTSEAAERALTVEGTAAGEVRTVFGVSAAASVEATRSAAMQPDATQPAGQATVPASGEPGEQTRPAEPGTASTAPNPG